MSSTRSQLFQTFAGNEKQVQTLIELTNDGRLCHALLLTGPTGCGKRTFARLAAAAMLCESGEKPCGVCPNCRKVLNGEHPDVVLLDCADHVHDQHKIDTLRDRVIRTVATAPNEAERRVYIIANFDEISYGTPNALLKTLEEPPAHVCFVLTALARERLPETILSRVSSIELEPLSDELVLRELTRRHPDADGELLRLASDFAFGCIGEGEGILSDPARAELAERAKRVLTALAARDEYAILAGLTLPDKKKEPFRLLLRTVLFALREGLRSAMGSQGRGIAPALADRLSVKGWAKDAELFESACEKVDANGNIALITAWIAISATRFE